MSDVTFVEIVFVQLATLPVMPLAQRLLRNCLKMILRKKSIIKILENRNLTTTTTTNLQLQILRKISMKMKDNC